MEEQKIPFRSQTCFHFYRRTKKSGVSMKRFVSIWFPHLLTDWFELRKPELKKIPFVLVKPDHGRMIITHGNTLAAKKGIHAGMVLADAKAIVPGLQKFDEPQQLESILLKKR